MNNQTLFWMILGIACLVGIVLLLRNPAPLPHNEYYNPISAADAISSLRKAPEKDVEFAVSRGFWDDESNWQSFFAAYELYFEQRGREITAILGPPTYEGHWEDGTFPLFAIGHRIMVWGSGDDTLYLRIQQEDREMGVEVALLTPRSSNSNHEPESPYEGLKNDPRDSRLMT